MIVVYKVLKCLCSIKITTTPQGLIQLEIEECEPNDSGAYKLAITNEHGKKVALCAVAVNRKYFCLTFTLYRVQESGNLSHIPKYVPQVES